MATSLQDPNCHLTCLLAYTNNTLNTRLRMWACVSHSVFVHVLAGMFYSAAIVSDSYCQHFCLYIQLEMKSASVCACVCVSVWTFHHSRFLLERSRFSILSVIWSETALTLRILLRIHVAQFLLCCSSLPLPLSILPGLWQSHSFYASSPAWKGCCVSRQIFFTLSLTMNSFQSLVHHGGVMMLGLK